MAKKQLEDDLLTGGSLNADDKSAKKAAKAKKSAEKKAAKAAKNREKNEAKRAEIKKEIDALKAKKDDCDDEKEIEKLKRQVVELSAEIGRSLLGESRFTPDILSTSIDNTNDLLHKKEIELSDIKYKLANQQNAMGRLDFYYSQFRTWADEFDNSTMEQKKMIACQLIREVKVSRGYELEIIFDLNYEQFLSL